VRRFLGYWLLLSSAYAVVGILSSWLVLNLVDLTYEAFAAWLLVPPAQALVLAASARKAPLLPAGHPPLLAWTPLAAGLGVVAAGLWRPLDARWGFLSSGSLQELLPRALAMLAGAALVTAGLRARSGRLPVAALGTLLLLLGFDAVRPFLASLPGTLLPRLNAVLGGLVTWGGLAALLFATALAAQRALGASSPWTGLFLGASLAFLFGALHGALLQLFLHPWLEKPWSLLGPAALSPAAALAAAGGLAALAGAREDP
jgi:hypothetical protein